MSQGKTISLAYIISDCRRPPSHSIIYAWHYADVIIAQQNTRFRDHSLMLEMRE